MKSTALFLLICCGALPYAEAWAQAQTPDTSLSIAAVLTHENALNEAHDVELEGNLAFVAGKGGSIVIINVADQKRFAEYG